jgi:hypothetical protein
MTKTTKGNMKTKTLLAMGLCAAIGFMGLAATRVFAAEEGQEHGEQAENGGKMKIPDTVEGIFKEIHSHHMELSEVVKNKTLAEVHHHAFAIRDLANALPAKAAAEKKKQVEGTTKSIARLAEDLDASGDANDQAKTEANLKKLDGLVKALETSFGIKSGGDAVLQYTCPMHPEVVQDKPGNCPKCNMELVEKH